LKPDDGPMKGAETCSLSNKHYTTLLVVFDCTTLYHQTLAMFEDWNLEGCRGVGSQELEGQGQRRR